MVKLLLGYFSSFLILYGMCFFIPSFLSLGSLFFCIILLFARLIHILKTIISSQRAVISACQFIYDCLQLEHGEEITYTGIGHFKEDLTLRRIK